MKKWIISLFVCVFLSACSSIPDGFDQSTLEQKSEEVIHLMENYQETEVISLLRTDLQAYITADQLHENLVIKYESVGEAQDKISFTISDTKDPQTNEIYATVIAQVKHEKGQSTYTISFNLEYELVGLYIK